MEQQQIPYLMIMWFISNQLLNVQIDLQHFNSNRKIKCQVHSMILMDLIWRLVRKWYHRTLMKLWNKSHLIIMHKNFISTASKLYLRKRSRSLGISTISKTYLRLHLLRTNWLLNKSKVIKIASTERCLRKSKSLNLGKLIKSLKQLYSIAIR